MRFKKVKEENGRYSETSKKNFKPLLGVNEYVKQSVVWAVSQEHFKENGRDKKTIIRNAIQGKLGEFGLYKYFKSAGYDMELPDLKIRGYGEYDNGDLFIRGKKIQIKTTKSYYNLLLLNKGDWDQNGNYKYIKDVNDEKDKQPYDAFFLCRIKPSTDEVIPDDIDYTIDNIIEYISNVNFRIDIPGFVSMDDFKECIYEERYLKNKNYLGKLKLDKDIYYFQAGDLNDIDLIPKNKK